MNVRGGAHWEEGEPEAKVGQLQSMATASAKAGRASEEHEGRRVTGEVEVAVAVI